MQRQFIHSNFFLQGTLAEELYHQYAENLPVLDFHSHLNPADLATNKHFANLAEAWIINDPYKHRAMRICGVSERGISGEASDEEKFMNWAKTLPKTLGNPLFLWSALELKRIFGIDEFLSGENAGEIWEACNRHLQSEGFGAADLLKKFNTEAVCTSDDLLDDLTSHQQANGVNNIRVYPSLRGDSILAFDQLPFRKWFDKLQSRQHHRINDLDDYKAAVVCELKRFAVSGCLLSDHSLDSGFVFTKEVSEERAARVFKQWLDEKPSDDEEISWLKNYLLFFLSEEYSRLNWIMQLHMGALRHTSSRLRLLAGPAGGYAAIGRTSGTTGLCNFFDGLEKKGCLPRIILYTLNPAENETFATLTGSYAEDGVPGKIQFGPAWWYNDHYEGIKKQLTALSGYGILSQFIGMTTDSRSVFSFSRHEYFRRVLCNLIASWVNEGNLPDEMELLGKLVQNLAYFNSKKWIFNR
jgi:glucuronate isomerase